MKKRWFSKILALMVRIPQTTKQQLEAEGIELFDKGILVTVQCRHFATPGIYSACRRTAAAGALILTRRRAVGFAFGKTVLDVPYDHPQFKTLQIHLEKPACLRISFDPHNFNEALSGQIDLRFHTPFAESAFKTIKSAQSAS
jgi:hypothetical protein